MYCSIIKYIPFNIKLASLLSNVKTFLNASGLCSLDETLSSLCSWSFSSNINSSISYQSFFKSRVSLILIFDAFSLIYLDSPNLFVNGFFFFLSGSWWSFRLIFIFLFSVCCGSKSKFSSVFIEPFNIALISSSFSLTVCNTSTLSSTRNVRFHSSLQNGHLIMVI